MTERRKEQIKCIKPTTLKGGYGQSNADYSYRNIVIIMVQEL